MEVLKPFEFATIICDGCGFRVDSSSDGETLQDYDTLVESYLPDNGWVQQPGKDKWLCPTCAKSKDCRKHPNEGRVIREPSTLSGICCDLCGRLLDYGLWSYWERYSDAEEWALNDEWQEIGGKFYCPDCYQECGAMTDSDEEHYEEAYCKKCPHKSECPEYWVKDCPSPSSECLLANREDTSGVLDRCRHYAIVGSNGIAQYCNLPKGENCPRISNFEKDKVTIAKTNKELLEKLNRKGN